MRPFYNFLLILTIASSCTYSRPLLCITKESPTYDYFETERKLKRGRYLCLSRNGIIGGYSVLKEDYPDGTPFQKRYRKMVNYKIQDPSANKRHYDKIIRYNRNGEKTEVKYLIIQYRKKVWTYDTIVSKTVLFNSGKRTVINHKKHK